MKCLNCGHEKVVQEWEICEDELGKFVVCDECDASFDIEEV